MVYFTLIDTFLFLRANIIHSACL